MTVTMVVEVVIFVNAIYQQCYNGDSDVSIEVVVCVLHFLYAYLLVHLSCFVLSTYKSVLQICIAIVLFTTGKARVPYLLLHADQMFTCYTENNIYLFQQIILHGIKNLYELIMYSALVVQVNTYIAILISLLITFDDNG